MYQNLALLFGKVYLVILVVNVILVLLLYRRLPVKVRSVRFFLLGSLATDLASRWLFYQGENNLFLLHVYTLWELLSNAYKYSQATAIKITPHLKPNALKLAYQDNGIGFDLNARGQQKGMGLKNIESRMRTIQADYRLDSTPGRGTAFTAQKTWS